MKKYFFHFVLFLAVLTACSCVKQEPMQPIIISATVIKEPTNGRNLGVIGEVEPIYFSPMKAPFSARIDTGAETSSVGVSNMKPFERDGEKWIAFDLVNKDTSETHHFEKKIHRNTVIKRALKKEERPVVIMDVTFGGETIQTEFTLADRESFEYQALVGRNILTGRALVDTSLSNTLY